MKRYMRTVCGRIAADMKEYSMAMAALLLYTVAVKAVFGEFCPLIIFSGFPCPGCGVTRATACFLTGRWQQAWQFNPVVFPIMVTAVYFGINRYLLGRKAKEVKWLVMALFVLLIVVYCVRMYLYFPNQAPYIYTQGNVFERFIPLYRQFLGKIGIL